MVAVRFGFKNERAEPVDVYVEPWPELFRLQPGQLLEFHYQAPAEGEWIQVEPHDEGITLWTGLGDQPEFFIDGKLANDWSWKL
jgi:hypothetical protein